MVQKIKQKKNTWLLFIWEFDLKYHYLFEVIYGPEFSVEEEQIIYGDISLGLKEFFQWLPIKNEEEHLKGYCRSWERRRHRHS